MKKSNHRSPTRGWDTYWHGANGDEAYAAGGVSHPAVNTFWDQVLNEFPESGDDVKALDIATGNGAVVEHLIRQRKLRRSTITCVDISAAAIDSVCSRYTDVTGVVADANSIPIPDCGFDLVTSQFGIEYAGPAALNEAMRLLAPSGTLILMMHIQPGVIFQECAEALDAIQRTQRCLFVQRSLRFLETGFAAVRGADRAAYEKAALELNPAIQELESILKDYGEHVAGDTVIKLYSDVQKIHSRIQHYEPDEVLTWLRSMDGELAEYEQRMASMCESASDAEAFSQICERLRIDGLDVDRSEALETGNSTLPIAWVLRATRANFIVKNTMKGRHHGR